VDRAELAVLTGKTLKPVVAALTTDTSTAGCTAAVAADREHPGAAAQAAVAVFALFGVLDVASRTPSQPKTQPLLTAVTQAMDVKEIINGIRR
jgi:hypothetical protein